MDQVVVSTPSGLFTVDAETGNISFQLNDSNASIVCPVGVAGQGGVTGTRIVCCPQLSKGLLHFWRFHSVNGNIESSGNPVYKCSSPEKFTALAFSSCGGLMFAGSPTGTIYVWQTWTGLLLRSWTAHFGAITCLRISGNDMHLFSASEDSTVKKYFLPNLFSSACGPVPAPASVFAGHTARITDVLVPDLGDRLVTASEDKSIKIFGVENGNQISNFAIENAVPHKICADHLCSKIYAGCSDGSVIAFPGNLHFQAFHKGPVTGLALTTDCSKLVSCGEDGVKIWDTASLVQVVHVVGPNQQLKNSLGMLMIRKPLQTCCPSGGTKLVLAVDAYLQFKPLQRTLTPLDSLDVIPLIRARAEEEPVGKVKNGGFCINRMSKEGNNFSSKDDIVANLTAELNKAKEAAKMWASLSRELYMQASALKPEGQVELLLPVEGADSTKRKRDR